MIETSWKETPQNITSKEQKKKIEKLKLLCKILEQEDIPQSEDIKESKILTEEERKCNKNDKKFIKNMKKVKKTRTES